jgi:hypothetical protein
MHGIFILPHPHVSMRPSRQRSTPIFNIPVRAPHAEIPLPSCMHPIAIVTHTCTYLTCKEPIGLDLLASAEGIEMLTSRLRRSCSLDYR